MVAQHIVVPFPNSHRWIGIHILIAPSNVTFLNHLPVDVNLAFSDRNNISWHTKHPLDERLAGILRIPENNDVATVDLLKVVDKLIDEDPFLIEQLRLHARAFDLHWLVQENDHQEGNHDSQQDVFQPSPELSQNSRR